MLKALSKSQDNLMIGFLICRRVLLMAEWKCEKNNLRMRLKEEKTAGPGGLRTLGIHSCVYPRASVRDIKGTKENQE